MARKKKQNERPKTSATLTGAHRFAPRSLLSDRPNAFPLHNVRHVNRPARPRQRRAKPNENRFSSKEEAQKQAGRAQERQSRWWSQTGSNRRPHACKARALPTELWPLLTLEAGPSRQLGGAFAPSKSCALVKKTLASARPKPVAGRASSDALWRSRLAKPDGFAAQTPGAKRRKRERAPRPTARSLSARTRAPSD
jgi:hypothetical protein